MINQFFGPYRFLSNFWPAEVKYDGHLFPSVENAYVAAKCNNPLLYPEIASLAPSAVKRYGRKVILRPDWEEVKVPIMRTLVCQKFEKHPDLMHALCSTHPEHLEEGNTWGDTFWGTCNGKGQNQLGKILMEIREELVRLYPHT